MELLAMALATGAVVWFGVRHDRGSEWAQKVYAAVFAVLILLVLVGFVVVVASFALR